MSDTPFTAIRPGRMPRVTRTGGRVTRFAAAGLAAVTGLTLAGCGSSHNPLAGSKASETVVVGSANFPESEIIAELYSLALAGKGVKVSDKFNIGTREVYYPEVKRGVITVIPEYNGTLLTTSVNPASTAVTKTQVNAALRKDLPKSLLLLHSSLAEDKDSVTVTQAFAKAHHLTSIAQLKPLASKMVFGGPPEFKTRADGLAGLKRHYGVTFKGFDPLDTSGPITLAALKDGKVQAADVFTTTPFVVTDHLVVLADPKNDFAAQDVTPLVYRRAMTPTIELTLDAVSSKLTTANLLALDNQVITDKASIPSVAAAWLKKEGIR